MTGAIDILLAQVDWKPLLLDRQPPETELPYATHEGILKVGEFEFMCFN